MRAVCEQQNGNNTGNASGKLLHILYVQKQFFRKVKNINVTHTYIYYVYILYICVFFYLPVLSDLSKVEEVLAPGAGVEIWLWCGVFWEQPAHVSG